MINNSSINRWNRLENKSLDQQFINEIIYGLTCSPFEASGMKPGKFFMRNSD